MTYTGDTTPDTRTLPGLEITKLSVGPMDNNAYLLRCTATGEQLLIDAANEADKLLALIGDGGLATVVTTHRHGDHWQALAEVVDGDRRGVASRTRPTRRSSRSSPRRVDDGDTVTVGDVDPRGDPPRRATRPARSRCCTATRPATRTCGPATRCSPAASATPRATPARVRDR